MGTTEMIALIATISGILLGWIGRTKAFKAEITKEATQDASLQTDVNYIKRGIDDLRVDGRLQSQQISGMNERLIRAEESTKQAHKRIDKLEE